VKSPEEFSVEFQGSMVVGQEVARRLHSDLKLKFLPGDYK
jgi:hypothetical protein